MPARKSTEKAPVTQGKKAAAQAAAAADPRSVACPKCGTVVDTSVVSTLLAGSDQLKALFAGTLNRPECPECGTLFLIDKPLVYRDTASAFIAYQVAMPEDGDTSAIEQEIDCMATDISSSEETERPTVRVTFTRSDFIEKIALRNDGYDDRLIEYAKFQLLKSLDSEELNHRRHRLLFDFSNQNPDIIAFIVFDRENNQPVSRVHVQHGDYDALLEEFTSSTQLMLELDALFPSCYVSCDRLIG